MITSGDPARDVTVVTFNARQGGSLTAGPETLMRDWGADIAAFQECGGELRLAIENMIGWHTSTGSALCVVSRFEILDTQIMEREVLESIGGSGLVTSYLLAGNEGPFWLTNLHLDTPRDGLELLRAGRLSEGIRILEQKSLLRDVELRRAQRFTMALSGPRITVGDFNTPPESRAYRKEWGGWTNAFSVAGFGIGGTRLNGWIRARIDHVVVDDSWKVVDAWLGNDVGSDHLPFLATVRVR